MSTALYKALPDGNYVAYDPREGTYLVVGAEHVPPLTRLRLSQPAAPPPGPKGDGGRKARALLLMAMFEFQRRAHRVGMPDAAQPYLDHLAKLAADPKAARKSIRLSLISVDEIRSHGERAVAQANGGPAPYGYCPECRTPATHAERRPDGNSGCANGHTFPRKKAKFSYVGVPLRGEAAARLLSLGSMVRAEDLADDGREQEPHVTVRYGLHTADPADVTPFVAGAGPAKLWLGKVSVFRGAETGAPFDVIKVDVDSPDLRRLNAALAALPHTDTHPEYQPHATIAYVKAGLGDGYAARMGSLDIEATAPEAEFSSAARERTVVRLSFRAEPLTRPNPNSQYQFKAVGDGPDAGRVLYGADAKKAIDRQQQRGVQAQEHDRLAAAVTGKEPAAGDHPEQGYSHKEFKAKQAAAYKAASAVAQLAVGREDVTAAHLTDLAGHLPYLTVPQLRSVRARLNTAFDVSFGGKARRAAMVESVMGHVRKELDRMDAEAGNPVVDAPKVAAEPTPEPAAAKVAGPGATALKGSESVPPHILDRVKDRLALMKERAASLARARDLDKKFGGEGRYESEVAEGHERQPLSDLLDKFREMAGKNGIDAERVIAEHGGEPDLSISGEAKSWRADVEARRQEKAGQKPPAPKTAAPAEKPASWEAPPFRQTEDGKTVFDGRSVREARGEPDATDTPAHAAAAAHATAHAAARDLFDRGNGLVELKALRGAFPHLSDEQFAAGVEKLADGGKVVISKDDSEARLEADGAPKLSNGQRYRAVTASGKLTPADLAAAFGGAAGSSSPPSKTAAVDNPVDNSADDDGKIEIDDDYAAAQKAALHETPAGSFVTPEQTDGQQVAADRHKTPPTAHETPAAAPAPAKPPTPKANDYRAALAGDDAPAPATAPAAPLADAVKAGDWAAVAAQVKTGKDKDELVAAVRQHHGDDAAKAMLRLPPGKAAAWAAENLKGEAKEEPAASQPQEQPPAADAAPAAPTPTPVAESQESPAAEPADPLAERLKQATAGIDANYERQLHASHKETETTHTRALDGAIQEKDAAEEEVRRVGSRQPERKNALKRLNAARDLVTKRENELHRHRGDGERVKTALRVAATEDAHPAFVRYAAAVKAKHDAAGTSYPGDEVYEHVRDAVRKHLEATGRDPRVADAVAAEVSQNPMRGVNKLGDVIAGEETRQQMYDERKAAREFVAGMGDIPAHAKAEAEREAEDIYAGDIGRFKEKWEQRAESLRADQAKKAESLRADQAKKAEGDRIAKERSDKEAAARKAGAEYLDAARAGAPPADAPPEAVAEAVRHTLDAPGRFHAGNELPTAKNAKQMLDAVARDHPTNRFALAKTVTEHGFLTDTKYMVKATPEMVAHAKAKGYDQLTGRTPPVQDVIDRAKGGAPGKIVATKEGEEGKRLAIVESEDGQRTVLDAAYAANILKLHPGAVPHVKGPDDPVTFKKDGEVVGLVMPLSGYAGKDLEYGTDSPLGLADVAEPGPFKADDIEMGGTGLTAGRGAGMMRLRIGGSGPYTIPGYTNRSFPTWAAAAKVGKDILSYAHGMDADGNLIFKPKGAGGATADDPDKPRRDFYAGLREKVDAQRAVKPRKMTFEATGDEPQEVAPATDHFGVMRELPDAKGKRGSGWNVVHLPTGKTFPGATWATKANALGHAHVLQGIPGLAWGDFATLPPEQQKEHGTRAHAVTKAFEQNDLHPDMALPAETTEVPPVRLSHARPRVLL